MPSITAFFPCYNDGGTIASMIALAEDTLRSLASDYEIIIVDDGSRDHSRRILQELARRYERLRVILHDRNRGYGGALRSGFAAASKDLIFYTDGDFQYDVSEMPQLLGALRDGVDVVNGYKTARSDSVARKLIGRVYHWLVKGLFGLRIRDVDCDFRLIRRAAIQKVSLLYDSGVICVELVSKLQDAGCRFAEVPVSHYDRPYGKSAFFKFRHVFQAGRDLGRLWWGLRLKPLIARRTGR